VRTGEAVPSLSGGFSNIIWDRPLGGGKGARASRSQRGGFRSWADTINRHSFRGRRQLAWRRVRARSRSFIRSIRRSLEATLRLGRLGPPCEVVREPAESAFER